MPDKNDCTIAYRTSHGAMIHGRTESFLASDFGRRLRGRVQLVFTSPPFPLNRKKRYGNEVGDAYIDWLAGFAQLLKPLLTPTGSIVVEMGNAWEPGKPVMSTLALRALLEFLHRGELHLCQQFICFNPTRLPSPAQWVNVRRIRLKDAYTHVWWMSPTLEPEADNRRVLKPYSDAMVQLLRRRKYNAGPRPSQHHIGTESFLHDNGGAIPPNVLTIGNTNASSEYLRYCRSANIKPHPARMPTDLAEFFIRFLTKPRGLVLDPFGGSNTTGAAAELLKRRWVSVEPNLDYIEGSKGRFTPTDLLEVANEFR
jgi:site-specific DNA-methyltransferase (cytosine-N4-specific)